MPCEPVPTTAGVVPISTTRAPSSTSNPTTSSLAFRMKRLGSGGGGARRALTALGTNDTQRNLRLAKSLLTISQEKFAKKWDFDPVREVPLPQGRFYWTPTTPSSTKVALDIGASTSSCCRLLGTVTSSSGSGSSHDADLAVAEAEDNAAALRTCLNLPSSSSSSRTSNTITTTTLQEPGPGVITVLQEPRVPPLHPEGPAYTPYSTTSITTTTAGPSSSAGAIAADAGDVSSGLPTTTLLVDKERPAAEAVGDTDASRRLLPTTTRLVDKERAVDASSQDNQCQYIDPTSGLPLTDNNNTRQQPTTLTQACITNYLRPRKRSSAHLQEASVHSSKAKKVLLAA